MWYILRMSRVHIYILWVLNVFEAKGFMLFCGFSINRKMFYNIQQLLLFLIIAYRIVIIGNPFGNTSKKSFRQGKCLDKKNELRYANHTFVYTSITLFNASTVACNTLQQPGKHLCPANPIFPTFSWLSKQCRGNYIS